MSVVRRFLVSPSLVRLIRKERGASRVTEGYFPPQGGRNSFVRVDGGQCHLVLVMTDASGTASEERTEVPRAHGDALLDVCAGKAAYDRSVVSLGNGREVLVDRYITPGAIDVVSVAFEAGDEANGFAPPAWFGAEVTADGAYEGRTIALQGLPRPGEVPLNNAALDAVLDLIEPRYGFGRYGGSRPAEEQAPRRVAAVQTPPPPQAPIPVEEPAPASEETVASDAVETTERGLDAAQAEHPEAEPVHAEHTHDETAQAETSVPASEHSDTRIDDVIASLSQALGAGAPQKPARGEEPAAAPFERWTVRPRRTQQS